MQYETLAYRARPPRQHSRQDNNDYSTTVRHALVNAVQAGVVGVTGLKAVRMSWYRRVG